MRWLTVLLPTALPGSILLCLSGFRGWHAWIQLWISRLGHGGREQSGCRWWASLVCVITNLFSSRRCFLWRGRREINGLKENISAAIWFTLSSLPLPAGAQCTTAAFSFIGSYFCNRSSDPCVHFLYMSQCLNQWRPVSFYGTQTGIWPGIWESNLCDVQSRQIRESRIKYFHLRINTFKVKQQWMWFKGALYAESIHLEGLLPTANKICLIRNSWFVLCRPYKQVFLSVCSKRRFDSHPRLPYLLHPPLCLLPCDWLDSHRDSGQDGNTPCPHLKKKKVWRGVTMTISLTCDVESYGKS